MSIMYRKNKDFEIIEFSVHSSDSVSKAINNKTKVLQDNYPDNDIDIVDIKITPENSYYFLVMIFAAIV